MEIQRHPLFPTALMFSELIQKHADADIPGVDKDAEYVTNLLPPCNATFKNHNT